MVPVSFIHHPALVSERKKKREKKFMRAASATQLFLALFSPIEGRKGEKKR